MLSKGFAEVTGGNRQSKHSWTTLELWAKEKPKQGKCCFTVAFKFDSKAQLLVAFEHECKQWAQRINLSHPDPLSLW